jgi:DNA primase
MSKFLLEEKVSEIRDRANILEVISDYVSLKKAGKNYRGLCPFHSEKTPSFMVNEAKQMFHCFGCGEGGDVFAFLMKVEHYSFPQAIEQLAKRYGISLPSREMTLGQKKEMAKRNLLFQINQIASEYYHHLLTQGRDGEEARRYLVQRGIGREMIEDHRLGYSLDRWDGLVQHLRDKKVSLELAWELGLILPKRSEGWYDVFRGRIIFPIFDLHRRVVGFGGRIIQAGEPKYLNSPESAIYHKGETLYGLQVAKGYLSEKECAIICEGYFDLLTLHRYGFKNSVATLGTALTTQHIRLLKRYTKNLITVFDSDQAGVQATLRTLPLFLEEDVFGKMVLLPKGEDPDTFLRKGRVEDFEKRVQEAIPLIDFVFDQWMRRYDPKSIEGKVKMAQEGVQLIAKVGDPIRRDFYLKSLAERLEVKESILYDLLRSSPKQRVKVQEEFKKQSMGEKNFPRSEELLVRLMIHHPRFIPLISGEGVIMEFESPLLRKIAETLEQLYQRKGRVDPKEALGFFEEDIQKRFCQLVFQDEAFEEDQIEKMVRDCIQKIQEKRFKKDRLELLKKIKEAEKKEGQGLEALLAEHQDLLRRARPS